MITKKSLMAESGILNVYKLNLCQALNSMFRVYNETIPKSFPSKFQYIDHKYETRQSKDNFIISKRNTRITRFAISRGPRILNSLTINQTEAIDFYPLFQSTIKENLLKLKTEKTIFNAAYSIFPSSYFFLLFLLLKMLSLVEKA